MVQEQFSNPDEIQSAREKRPSLKNRIKRSNTPKLNTVVHNNKDHEQITASKRYERKRDLPKLISIWPHEVEDESASGQSRILARLERALRKERQRGIAGHWTYDLTRHHQLRQAVEFERATLRTQLRLPNPGANQRRVPRPIFLAKSERARA